MPPKGPGHFYPFFTQAKVGGRCVWEFGNMTNGKDSDVMPSMGRSARPRWARSSGLS